MANHDPVQATSRSTCWREGVVTKDDIAEISSSASRRSSRRATSTRIASPFPEPGDVTKGLWVEDGYWTSEPGRGGGTEAG